MNCYFFKAREGGAYGCNRPGDNSGAYFRVEDVMNALSGNRGFGAFSVAMVRDFSDEELSIARAIIGREVCRRAGGLYTQEAPSNTHAQWMR